MSPVMSMNTKVPGVSGNPVVASTGRDEEPPLSPVQRMRGKIQIANPAMIRRIIFDPSLDAV